MPKHDDQSDPKQETKGAEHESLGERVARIFCREMPQEQNSQENLAALVDRLAGAPTPEPGTVEHATANAARARAENAATAVLDFLGTHPPRETWVTVADLIAQETDVATLMDALSLLSRAGTGEGRWRCEGCGEYVEPDPSTPQGRGHPVPNADGSPGFCGPISREPSRAGAGGKWTKEKPKVPGPYWLRRPPNRVGFIVDVCGPGDSGLWWVSAHMDGVVDETDGEWSGPIPAPEE